ncbi:MAG: cytochrome c oxidase assembly protein [Gammaproteobacteria bacterium]|nr:cytochrome c oxidase assembly protein [Gammaproteobacteria bacterium]MDE2349022.1 cytochrome c oxidase assembly protein [Gammaproteobacteria bacterium]
MDGPPRAAPPERRPHRKLVTALLIIAGGSFALSWGLIPLYTVFSRDLGVGNAESKEGPEAVHDRIDASRTVTVEFIAYPASVGNFDFRPQVAEMRVHPGAQYDVDFVAKNRTAGALTARAVPSLAPQDAWKYFHKMRCFCFDPQNFAVGETRALPVRFVVDPTLPVDIDRLSLSFTLYDAPQAVAH